MKELIALSLLALVGCSLGRTYHAKDSMYGLGYTDTQIASDTWNVSYKGYEIQMSEAEDYALLRAAQVVQQAGFPFFTLGSERTSTTSNGMVVGNSYQGSGSVFGASSSYPEINLRVRGHKNRPQINDTVYEAEFVISSITKKYGL